jgi:hypothetical protein
VMVGILLVLFGCGGGSSSDEKTAIDDTSSPGTATTVQYRVIDGYLSNSDVCIIVQGDTHCESIGKTDGNGIIAVSGDITAGQIVATIIAGQTQDSDGVGFMGRSYQMIAEISVDTPNVITPFTTLNSLDSTRTMNDIATLLSANKDDNDVSALHTQIAAINEYINTELINANVDLNNVNIFMDGDSVMHKKAIGQLSDFLENGEVYTGSLSSAFFAMEGV